MPDVAVLEVLLYRKVIGTLTRLQGDRTLFAFTQDYIDDANRPTLGLSFKDVFGVLLTDFAPTHTRVARFFANMLPEEELRNYLAARAGVDPKREFFLLWVLGKDLPGAVTIRPADGETWPKDAEAKDDDEGRDRKRKALRFSLAGVQLKFSAVNRATGGLTIPAQGVGGSWIVKLPSAKYEGVPENEFSMMTLAEKIGIDVPEIKLIDLAEIDGLPDGIGNLKGQAFAIKRFDREGDERIHVEDFAQIYGVYPEEKYRRASYRNIASVIATESGEDDVVEFVRRLVFNTMIGNADMHLKNWSLIYPDQKAARLAPAYDFLSTIPYIADDKAALKYARTKRMDEFDLDELAYLAAKAKLPEKLTRDTATETAAKLRELWESEKKNLPIDAAARRKIDKHIVKMPLG